MSDLKELAKKYNLPRQIVPKELLPFLSAEIKRQEEGGIGALPKKNMKQLVELSKIIKKEGLPKQYILKKLPNKLGYGLFLRPNAKPIPEGTLIAPYAGEVMLEAQNDPNDSAYAFAPLTDIKLSKHDHELLDPGRKYHPNRLYSISLDAQHIGNFTRFINHSTLPNVEAEVFKVPRNAFGLEPSPCEVFYRALEKILPGQQLLVCYEDEEETYWKPFKIKPYFMTADTFQVDKNLELIETD